MNVFIILDRPHYNNDKKWLVDNLQQQSNHTVIPIYTKEILSVVYRNGLIGKLKVLKETIWQCIYTLWHSEKDDTIICWTTMSSQLLFLFAFLLQYKRYYIAMNWISPQSTKGTRWLKKIMAENKRVRIVVNTPALKPIWQKVLLTDRSDAFFYIPDVYDTRIPFRMSTSFKKDYFFTGGMSNRDWRLIQHLATKFPTINFVCCALEKDFKEKTNDIPANMIVHFNTPSKDYYQLLSNSFAVLLPLCTTIVSGLINIIRSAQEGILCLTSDTPATSQYYDKECKDLLIPFNESEWEMKIEELLMMTDEEIVQKRMAFSSYIKKEFSPQNAVTKLVDLLP